MKKYNIENYIRYKEDLSSVMPKDKDWESYTRNELITKIYYSQQIQNAANIKKRKRSDSFETNESNKKTKFH